MSTPQQHRLIGQVIAERYRVVELLAEGGMGAVYIADHLTLHKQVALKIVHPEHAGNAELTARFAREAMATSRIDHPNVISAIDFGTLPDDTAFLAVQLVRGPSLTRVLTDGGRLPWARVADIGSQIADALSAAHGHGIVHRDLKPDNVLLQIRDDGSELVKVLDFGVAKFAPESQVPLSARTDVTQIGMVVGTPGYMAPEQTIGNPADERSDLYALGVILWECIIGEPLWSAPDLQALVEKQMGETPRALREATGDQAIPIELEELVAQLLSRRGEERPSGAAMVRDELRRIASLDPDRPRWRTGARPVPRAPDSNELTIPLESSKLAQLPGLDPAATAPALVIEEVKLPTPSAAPKTKPPSVPPPPPPSLRSRRPLRSSRTAWVVVALLGVIIAGAVALVATGRVELRPSREVAEVAQRVAKQLDIAPQAPGEKAKEGRTVAQPSGLPEELDAALRGLLAAEGRGGRNDAAERVLAHTPAGEVPDYLRQLAELQLAKTCEAKREQVAALGVTRDARALPFLQRLAQRPRVGCGKKKRDDCLACLRKPLATSIEALSALSAN